MVLAVAYTKEPVETCAYSASITSRESTLPSSTSLDF